ncbi:MAG TPA: hypothetical protein VES95_09540 [Dermatophilaceae bacterium]|nr:hypothetical protein [Dermatophilaceae bacterium]
MAVNAEFEDDPAAVAEPTNGVGPALGADAAEAARAAAARGGAEREALRGAVERLRAEGLAVLDPQDAPEPLRCHALANVRTAHGAPVPPEQWPTLEGAADGGSGGGGLPGPRR